ncbi:hypothetical protein Y1Q_0016114 [Alligator mississippiensis]|uniref:Endonuclease/exonuclease/phosphatase domain-containing protein n=1 Tax=Alligator mississippiensis TaxID=8496 RepID=A0A151P1N5_ALLMI|nr:hypothetical protein Y1Q_0016114 [Alligator mississippiensis]
MLDSIMGWEKGTESWAKGKAAVPSEKAVQLGSFSVHAKGFTISDLLGLEAELQPPLTTATIAKGKGGDGSQLCNNQHAIIIRVYAPVLEADVKKQFYSNHDHVLINTYKKDKIILFGDFNT